MGAPRRLIFRSLRRSSSAPSLRASALVPSCTFHRDRAFPSLTLESTPRRVAPHFFPGSRLSSLQRNNPCMVVMRPACRGLQASRVSGLSTVVLTYPTNSGFHVQVYPALWPSIRDL